MSSICKKHRHNWAENRDAWETIQVLQNPLSSDGRKLLKLKEGGIYAIKAGVSRGGEVVVEAYGSFLAATKTQYIT